MECWSTGVMECGWYCWFPLRITPIFHYSNTPVFFQDIMLTFDSTSVVETICRLRFISFGSKPSAKPTN